MQSHHLAASFVFLFLFSLSLVSAIGIDNKNIPIVRNDPVEFPDNFTANISVDSARNWDTLDHGQLDSVSDISHVWLSGIQGGSINEYYHVNSSVYTYLIANLFDFLTGNIFDQSLNTTDDVDFNSVTVATDVYANHINATTGNFTDLYVSNNTLYVGEIKMSSSNDTIFISNGGNDTTVTSGFFEGDGSRLRNINLTSVNGTATFNNNVTINGFLIVNGTTILVDNATVNEILDMTGNPIVDVDYISPINYIDWNITPAIAHQEGRMHWDADDGTIAIGMPGGTVELQVGQEQLIRVTNKEGVDIDNCKAVYISGASGAFPEVKLSGYDKDFETAQATAGITTEAISNNQKGYINVQGIVRGCDTSNYSEGQPLYLGADGEFSPYLPTAPNSSVFIGVVIRSHATEGSIINLIDTLPLLTDLSDVINGQENNSVLSWNNDTQRWEPRDIQSVNSSEYWNDMSSINSTVLENNDGVLNIIMSFFYNLFYTKEEANDTFVRTQGYSFINGSLNVTNIYAENLNVTTLTAEQINAINITAETIDAVNMTVEDLSASTLFARNFTVNGTPEGFCLSNGTGCENVSANIVGVAPWIIFDGENVSFNETKLQEEAEVTLETEVTVVTIAGGVGSATTANVIDFEIKEIDVACTPGTNFRFEATETTSSDVIDKDRKVHINDWRIEKNYPINDTVDLDFTSVTPASSSCSVTIKYLDNFA